ncbi:WhiB family transcriptional regulator [Mycobacterium sp. SM1]|uniref:WhiB family transcriptional regulator n=1 Tax=Mycobacterium sp. SM1 TaxID=2816243 RepID=UPI001BD0981D|nr:WhiB family transcriptional regulator [Mycobacterium sp. SM1]MBS4730553.1 WhiB family transcriptional regulator [Mycobacterium sp. SM1]
MLQLKGQHWRLEAVCYLESADAPELWTPERRPPRNVRVHLEAMCQRCPVRRQCAEDAVLAQTETGMYAGVWVPERKEANGWGAAMDELRRIADLDPGIAGLAALRVSA